MKRLDESLLAPLPLFQRISHPQIREILDLATSRRHDEGSPVFRAGDPADRFFLLLDGTIRVVRLTPEGEQIIVMHIPAGQLFGIAPAIGAKAYPATAYAAAESLSLSWPTALWHQFVARYEGFGPGVAGLVGERMEQMHARIADLATRQVEQRVSSALLRLVQQSGKQGEDGIEIDFPITRLNIADMTGTTLHTVSRLLSGWEKDGLLISKRRNITVADPHRLVLLANGSG